MFQMRKRLQRGWIILLLGCIFLTVSFALGAETNNSLQKAPINSLYTSQLEAEGQHQALYSQQTSANGYPLGYQPPLIDSSYLSSSVTSIDQFSRLSYPFSYDLRITSPIKVTPIGNQGNSGCCWAFATYGSLESCLLPSETRDFSENNLKNTHGFDWDPNIDGGNGDISTAYLARWSGPINDADDPYNDTSTTSASNLTVQKHVQEVIKLPDCDKNEIKNAITTYGGVFTSMRWEDIYYNSDSYAYYDYYPNDWKTVGKGNNHAVTIVGWNDNYLKSNFKNVPSGNGAWIVKNSWGTSFGEQGYFYVSYYDSNFARSNYVFNNAEPTNNYQRKYEYDRFGDVMHYGYGSTTAWIANVFTAEASEPLVAVSFYALNAGTSYTIKIYNNVGYSPIEGSLAVTTTGTIAKAGYHTVKLPSYVTLAAGVKFSVVIKLTTPKYNYPMAFEVNYPGYSSNAPAVNSGQSFSSKDGIKWEDLYNATDTDTYKGNIVDLTNFKACIKAFTRTAPVITQQPVSQTVGETQSATFSVTAVGTPIPTDYQWYFKGNDKDKYEAIGALSSSYTINGVTTANAGKYYVVIKNDKGETTSAEATLTVIPLVSTPTFNPDGGTYRTPWQVKVSCSTPGVTIRYTTDGSEPTEKSPVVASGGFVTVNKPDTTLKAKAWKTGWAPSNTKSDLFNITGTVATPTFDTKPGLYMQSKKVAISSNPKDAVIRYTTDGTEPTEKSPTTFVYSDTDKVTLANNLVAKEAVITVKAKAWKTDWDVSATATATYTITGQVAAPVLDHASASYQDGITVKAYCETTGAVIRYTASNTSTFADPTAKSPAFPSNGLVIGNDTYIKVKAFKANWTDSAETSAHYTFDRVAAPKFSLLAGPYYKPQSVTISCATTGASIYYTIDGTDPSKSASTLKYTAAIAVKKNITINAIAQKTGVTDSAISSATYLITGTVPTPTISPSSKAFAGSLQITAACDTSKVTGLSNVEIRYTTDGSEPVVDSTKYIGPTPLNVLDMTGPLTIKAKAFAKDWAASATATVTYTPIVPAPTFSLAAGSYDNKQVVRIVCNKDNDHWELGKFPGVTIRYTMNNDPKKLTAPTAASPIVPEDGIVVDHDMTIVAACFRSGWITDTNASTHASASSATYAITTVADPVFSLAPGTYSKPQTLTISCATPGAQILYGVSDGTVKPTPKTYSAGTKITLPVGTTMVAATAKKNDKTQSSIVTATYKVLGAITTAPTFSPGSKTLTAGGSQDVTLGCATRGVSFIYTVDGSTPTLTNGLAYAGPIHVTGTTTLKAIAVMDGCTPSPVATAVYTGTLDTPEFKTDWNEEFKKDTQVVITPSDNDKLKGAVVRYTTDGKTNPSLKSPVAPDGGITINRTTTIKAQVYMNGWAASQVISKTYSFTGVATPAFTIPSGTITAPSVTIQATTLVTISCVTPNVVIHYTTDSTEPTETSPVYTPGKTKVYVTSFTLKAKAWKTGVTNPSDTRTVTFTCTGTVEKPTLSVNAGSYSVAQTVKISCATPNADIYYTTNGTEPSVTNGTKIASDDEVPINKTTTLKVKAFRTNYIPSATVTAVYTLYQVDTPTVTPVSSTDSENPVILNPGQLITLNCGTAGATIRYTTNGNDPSLSDPAVTPGTKINIGMGPVNLKARAWKTGLNPSDTLNVYYKVNGLTDTYLNSQLSHIVDLSKIQSYLGLKFYHFLVSGQFVLGNGYSESSFQNPNQWTGPDADGWYTGTYNTNEPGDSMILKLKSPNSGEIYGKMTYSGGFTSLNGILVPAATSIDLTAKKGTDGLWDGSFTLSTDSYDAYESNSRYFDTKYHVNYTIAFADVDYESGKATYQVTGTYAVPGKPIYKLTGQYVCTYDGGLNDFYVTGSETFNGATKTVEDMFNTSGDNRSDAINSRLNSVKQFVLVQNYVKDKFANFLASGGFTSSGNAIGTGTDSNFTWNMSDSDGWYTKTVINTDENGNVSTKTLKFKSANANDIKLKVIFSTQIKNGPLLNGSADLIVARDVDKWSGTYNASYDTVQDNLVYHTSLAEQIADADLASGAGNYGITATFQVQGGSYYGLTASYSVDQSRVFTVNQETFNACAVSVLTSKQINDILASIKMIKMMRNYVHDKFAYYLFGFTNGQFMFAGPYQYYGSTVPAFTWSLPDKDNWYTAVIVDPYSKAKWTCQFQLLNSKITFITNAPNYSMTFEATQGSDNLWKGHYTENYNNTSEVNYQTYSWRTDFSEDFEQVDLATGAGKYTSVSAKFYVPPTAQTPTHTLTANYEVTYDPATQNINVSGSETFDGNPYSPNDNCTLWVEDDGDSSGNNDTGVSSPSQVNQLISTMPTFGLVDGYVKDKFANFLNGGKSSFSYNSTVTPSSKWVIPLNVQWWQQPVENNDIPEGANTNDYIKFVNGGTAPTDASGAIWSDVRLLWNKVTKSYSLHFVRTFTTTLNGSPVQLTSTVDFEGTRTHDLWTDTYSWTGGYGTKDQDLGYDASQNKTVIYNTYLKEHFDHINLVTCQGKYYQITATFQVQGETEADAQFFYLTSDPGHETWYQVKPNSDSSYSITGQETFNGTNIDNINDNYNYR